VQAINQALLEEAERRDEEKERRWGPDWRTKTGAGTGRGGGGGGKDRKGYYKLLGLQTKVGSATKVGDATHSEAHKATLCLEAGGVSSHPAPCTLYPAPCTLHPAPCTLHLARRTRQPASTQPREIR
jgi:hypothetical protein